VCPLPYTNFSQTAILLHVGQVVGILEECLVSLPIYYKMYLGLVEVFKGLSLTKEGAKGIYPDRYLYLILQLQTNTGKANVSNY
jgi:hypothetical protein